MYYLGVDGGGTKTEALICDRNGVVKGWGYAGGSNYIPNEKQAYSEIERSVNIACEKANISIKDITYACFGLAGADRKKDIIHLEKLLSPLGIKNFTIKVDAYIGLRAMIKKPKGIAIVCGTSTNAIGVYNDTYFQLGGFGYFRGDFGGGSFLSKETFRHVIRVAQGREDFSYIVELVLKQLNFPTIQKFLDYYLNNLHEIPVHLTPLIFEAAQSNDVFANKLLNKQAEELALSTYIVYQKLFSNVDGPIPVIFIGSLLTKPDTYILREKVISHLETYSIDYELYPFNSRPVFGANIVALMNCGHGPFDLLQKNLNTTYMGVK